MFKKYMAMNFQHLIIRGPFLAFLLILSASKVSAEICHGESGRADMDPSICYCDNNDADCPCGCGPSASDWCGCSNASCASCPDPSPDPDPPSPPITCECPSSCDSTPQGESCGDNGCGDTCYGTQGCPACASGTTFCHDGSAPCYICMPDAQYHSLSTGANCSYSCECKSGSCNCDQNGSSGGSGHCCGASGSPNPPPTGPVCAPGPYGAAGR
jgi:hypothetical protein